MTAADMWFDDAEAEIVNAMDARHDRLRRRYFGPRVLNTTTKTAELRRTICALFDDGKSVSAIAREVSKDRATVRHHLRECGRVAGCHAFRDARVETAEMASEGGER